MKRKVLRGIRTPAEFEARSCYYTQLMAAYTKYGADARIVAAGYLPLYSFNFKEVWPAVRGCEILDQKVLQRLTGVKRTVCQEIADLREFAVGQIEKGRVIILPVDCCELDYRNDFYRRRHVIHFILIFGYDLEKKVFFANEHFYYNSQKYRRMPLQMETIVAAQESYLRHLRGKDGFSAVVVSKAHNQKRADFIAEFRRGLALHKREFQNSRAEFQASLSLIREWMKDPKELKRVQEVVIEAMAICRSNKTYERNLLHALGQVEAFRVVDRIVEDYIFLYGIFVKTKLTGWQAKSMEKACRRFEELEGLERELRRCWEEMYG